MEVALFARWVAENIYPHCSSISYVSSIIQCQSTVKLCVRVNKVYIVKIFYHPSCVLMLSAALEDKKPQHETILHLVDILFIHHIQLFLVKEEVLLPQEYVLVFLVTESNMLITEIREVVWACGMLLQQSYSHCLKFCPIWP